MELENLKMGSSPIIIGGCSAENQAGRPAKGADCINNITGSASSINLIDKPVTISGTGGR